MNFVIIGKTYNLKREFLEKVAKAAFSYFDKKIGVIEFCFVTENEIKRLNTVYRGKNKPTDILSFVLDENPLLAQIFICYNISKGQAKEYGRELDDEIAHLLVHGILHSYGFDHEKIADEGIMKKKEIEILNKLGIEI